MNEQSLETWTAEREELLDAIVAANWALAAACKTDPRFRRDYEALSAVVDKYLGTK